MKIFRNLTFIVLSIFLVNSSFAAEHTYKIGVVNVRDILAKSEEAKSIQNKLESEFGARKDKIIAVQKTLQEKTEKYRRDREILSEAERKKMETEIFEAQREAQRMEQEFQEDGNIRQRQETESFLQKVGQVVNEVAKENKFDLIIHRDAAPYVSEKIDITNLVLSKLEAKKK